MSLSYYQIATQSIIQVLNNREHLIDLAKSCAARLANVDVPSYEDNKVTFEQLKARIAKTIDFIKTEKESDSIGCEDRNVTLNWYPESMSSEVFLL